MIFVDILGINLEQGKSWENAAQLVLFFSHKRIPVHECLCAKFVFFDHINMIEKYKFRTQTLVHRKFLFSKAVYGRFFMKMV